MKVFLTGVNGFLGAYMARYWAGLGHEIWGSSHSWPDAGLRALLGRAVTLEMAGAIGPEELAGADVVVHLAYARQASLETNVAGVRRVALAAEAAGVPRQIYISSYSARPDAISEYGRLKYQLETFFLERGHTVARPGLVVGQGGLFGRNVRKILSTPVMPLLDGGADLLALVAVEELAAALTAMMTRPSGAYNLFHQELISMRRFLEAVNRAGGRRGFYVNIPLGVAVAALRWAARLHLPLPVDLDNLRGLKQSQHCPHASDLPSLLGELRGVESILEEAVRRYKAA